MKAVPQSRFVRRAFRHLHVAVRNSQKALDLAAGKRLAKGDYTLAESLTAKSKAVRVFQGEVELLSDRWKELSRVDRTAASATATKQWEFYQPILRGLAEAGGQLRVDELEKRVWKAMGQTLTSADTSLKGGRERWRRMVHRARGALVSEGWIEVKKGRVWQITDQGRVAALSGNTLQKVRGLDKEE